VGCREADGEQLKPPFFTRLKESIARTGSVLCAGYDPRWESLPEKLRQSHGDTTAGRARAYAEFGHAVIDACAGRVAAFKPQSAFFEALGVPGWQALTEVVQHAHAKNLLVILDAKRGDIATTGEAYARMAFAAEAGLEADALTVAPYMGEDSVYPFCCAAQQAQAGIFVLCRTSNIGSGLFQNLKMEEAPLYRFVAAAIEGWNSVHGVVGAVVGATHPREIVELRSAMPGVWFLVPGYGAQGGMARDLAPAFRDDEAGAIVNSSRGITFPFKTDDPDWRSKIDRAIDATNRDLNAVR
jgi:orotidine-5'-phosphate decarboxylase